MNRKPTQLTTRLAATITVTLLIAGAHTVACDRQDDNRSTVAQQDGAPKDGAPQDSAPTDSAPEWDPTIGQPGMTGHVRALTVWNGDLIASGNFTTAGGQTVNYIARWDGSQWHPFIVRGEIGVGGTCLALTEYDGELIVSASGVISKAGWHPITQIARWDGTQWYPLQSGILASALTVYNGELIAGGAFERAERHMVNRIARWDGSQWHPMTSGGQIGMNRPVRALAVYNGELIAGGEFTEADGQTVNRIARLDGAQWHPLTSGDQIGVWRDRDCSVLALTVYDGDLIAGGTFTTAGGQIVNNIARWDGSQWHPMASGDQIGLERMTSGGRMVVATVHTLMVYDGDLIAGGRFNMAGGQRVNYIARWDGSQWHPLTSDGQNGVSSSVYALTEYNGDLIIGGSFSKAGGREARRIARWGRPR